MAKSKTPILIDGDKLKVWSEENRNVINLPDNLVLIERLNNYTKKNITRYEVHGTATKQDLLNFLSWSILKIALGNAIHIYLFHTSPQKVINWIKRDLSRYEINYRETILTTLIEVVKNKRRFDFTSQHLPYIIDALEKTLANRDYFHNVPDGQNFESYLKYFTGTDSIEAEKCNNAWLRVQGLLQTKQEHYTDFINENFNPDFLQALKEQGKLEFIPTPGSKTELSISKGNTWQGKKSPVKDNKSYSHMQVCIAYHFMGGITEKNALKLLQAHTRLKSAPTLLRKRIGMASDLTKLSLNKTADTKHLNDLKEAKRLISGKKNKEALNHITHTIAQFQANYNKHY